MLEMLGSSNSEENRQQHQPGAMGGRHQKRPEGEVAEPHLHTDPPRVAFPHEAIKAQRKQDSGHWYPDIPRRNEGLCETCRDHHYADGEPMAQRDWHERSTDRP